MPTTLIKNPQIIVTMNSNRDELSDASIFIRDNVIEKVGSTDDLPATADTVIDLSGHVVLPGLVNTHHHMYQTLTRVLATNRKLFDWLKMLYPIWANISADAVYTSALIAMAELIKSGCTTTSDHLYIVPNDASHDDEIRAAQEIGIRFHVARGSMSLGESKGGLPPDSVVEDEAAILRDSQRLIETYHDPSSYSMLRVALAPCSPFSVTGDLMRESAAMAVQYDVTLHTHLAETLDEEEFCLTQFGLRPVDYMESLGWLGDNVWHAHCIHMNAEDIKLFAQTQTGVAHCPSSNMILASGIAPVRTMRDSGIPVGIGVDGSASNDGNHMLAEVRQAMLLQRVLGGAEVLPPREALEIATLGGAAVFRRDDIGSLEPGKAADLIAIDTRHVEYAGAHDRAVAAVYCAPRGVDFSMINGKVVVQDGELTTFDLPPIIERHNRIAKSLVVGS